MWGQVVLWKLPSTLYPDPFYKLCICWSFVAHGPFVRCLDRNTGNPLAQSGLRGAIGMESASVGVCRERIERQVRVVALADQEAERTFSVATLAWRSRKAATQDPDRAFQLGLLGVRARFGCAVPCALWSGVERAFDEVPIDAAREQSLSNPLPPPLGKLTLVLDEQPRKPRVVDRAFLGQDSEGLLTAGRIDAVSLEVPTNFARRTLAPVQVAVGER